MDLHGPKAAACGAGASLAGTTGGYSKEIAGIRFKRRYDLNAPKGVNGRNSDNPKILESLG